MSVPAAEVDNMDGRKSNDDGSQSLDTSGAVQELHEYIEYSRAQELRLLLDAHPHILQAIDKRYLEEYGETPLGTACRCTGPGIVKMLLDNDASPLALNWGSDTPLMIAAERHNYENIDLLLDRTPPETRLGYVNMCEKHSGRPALTLAMDSILEGLEETERAVRTAKSLVDAGADVNIVDNQHMSAAHVAAMLHKGPSVLKILFNKDPSCISRLGGTQKRNCLHFAVKHAHLDTVAWLLDVMDMEDIAREDGTESEMTPWMAATLDHDFERRFRLMSCFTKRLKPSSHDVPTRWRIDNIDGTFRELVATMPLNCATITSEVFAYFMTVGCASLEECVQFAAEIAARRTTNGIIKAREPSVTVEYLSSRTMLEVPALDRWLSGAEELEVSSAEEDLRSEAVRPETTSNHTDSDSVDLTSAPKDETPGVSGDGESFGSGVAQPEAADEVEGSVKNATFSASAIELKQGPAGISQIDEKPDYVSVVIPYFHIQNLEEVDDWRNDRKRKKLLEDLIDFYLFEANPCSYSSAEVLDIHIPLTLDEYCNPMLGRNSLNARNLDQVYTRASHTSVETRKEGRPAPRPLLMVNQVWIWNLQAATIVSPTYTHGTNEDRLADAGRGAVDFYNLFGLGFRDNTDSDNLREVGVAMSRLIRYLEQPLGRAVSIPVLAVYERAITDVSEEVNRYSQERGVEAIRVDEERLFIHRINDIREELSMINRVISQQEEVFKQYVSAVWPQYWSSEREGRLIIPREDWTKIPVDERKPWREILQTQPQIQKYRRRIAELDEDAGRVQQYAMTQLELKTKDATIREAHNTAIMSAAVLGFTVVTIIFTPLSFVASLFALPIDQLQRHQQASPYSSDSMYTSGYFGAIAVGTEIASLVITLAAVWAALHYGMGVHVFGKMFHTTGNSTKSNAQDQTAIVEANENEESSFQDLRDSAENSISGEEVDGALVEKSEDPRVKGTTNRFGQLFGPLRHRKRNADDPEKGAKADG